MGFKRPFYAGRVVTRSCGLYGLFTNAYTCLDKPMHSNGSKAPGEGAFDPAAVTGNDDYDWGYDQASEEVHALADALTAWRHLKWPLVIEGADGLDRIVQALHECDEGFFRTLLQAVELSNRVARDPSALSWVTRAHRVACAVRALDMVPRTEITKREVRRFAQILWALQRLWDKGVQAPTDGQIASEIDKLPEQNWTRLWREAQLEGLPEAAKGRPRGRGEGRAKNVDRKISTLSALKRR